MWQNESKIPRIFWIILFVFHSTIIAGYSVGFLNLVITHQTSPDALEFNIHGMPEEIQEKSDTLVLPKTLNEMIITTHNHVISLSILFLITGLVFIFFQPSNRLQLLTVEPFISLITTFGSLWLVFLGFTVFKYLAYISGIIMHATFYFISISNSINLFKKIIANDQHHPNMELKKH